MTFWVRIKDGNPVEETRSFGKALEKVKELERLDDAIGRKITYEIVTEEGKVLA